mgnify:CR=1 FL=1
MSIYRKVLDAAKPLLATDKLTGQAETLGRLAVSAIAGELARHDRVAVMSNDVSPDATPYKVAWFDETHGHGLGDPGVISRHGWHGVPADARSHGDRGPTNARFLRPDNPGAIRALDANKLDAQARIEHEARKLTPTQARKARRKRAKQYQGRWSGSGKHKVYSIGRDE